jgi:ankyrin repeat protein
MNAELDRIFVKLCDTADFANVDFSDVNACNTDGDNALHCVVRWGDVSAAKALIDAGVDVNKAGDLGYTPLRVACINGNVEIVRLLVEKGGDLFAMSEGDIPFSSARLAGHHEVCDILGPLMTQAQTEDQKIWVRARIAQLRREISRLEKGI